MISVIVPIYMVEKYLKRCVNSLLAQSYSDFELILVDDGSPDNCGNICEEYAAKDKRIRVIHKENGGLSDARNAGLRIAKGEYIAFVDSDDWVATNYLETLLKVIELTDSDICECEVLKTKGEIEKYKKSDEQYTSYSSEKALELLICDRILHQYVWNKLYKRSCLKGIPFAVGKINEDEFWTYQVFGNARRITKISNVLYYYFQRGSSIMGNHYNLKRLDALEAKSLRQQYIEEKFPALTEVSKINLFESCIYSGQMTLKFLEKNEKKQAKGIIDDIRICFPCNIKQLMHTNGSSRWWCILAKVNFWGLCRLKNLLGKGF